MSHTLEWSLLADLPRSSPDPLPASVKASIKDDWTSVTDRKEKKRIQNRNAQRLYRKRIKIRMAELQEKVKRHEKSERPKDDPEHDSNGNTQPSLRFIPDGANQKGTEMTPLIMWSDGEKQQPEVHPNLVGELASCYNSTLHLYDLPDTSDTLEAQPTPRSSSPRSEQSDRQSQSDGKSDLDYMSLPLQLQGRPNSQLEEPRFPTLKTNDLTMPQMMNNTPQEYRSAPLQAEDGEHYPALDNQMDPWGPGSHRHILRRAPFSTSTWSSESQPANCLPGVRGPAPVDAALNESEQAPPFPDQGPSLHDRLECVMEYVSAAGFANFDSLVTAYYNESFGESSHLSYEQRLSRNRRLPEVVASIFRAAKSWSTWECWGFYEELLKATEDILTSENSTAWSTLSPEIAPFHDMKGTENTAESVQVANLLKTMIPNKLPNLWALMMALASSDGPAWQRDCPSTARATILMLHFAGRMETEKLLSLIRACL